MEYTKHFIEFKKLFFSGLHVYKFFKQDIPETKKKHKIYTLAIFFCSKVLHDKQTQTKTKNLACLQEVAQNVTLDFNLNFILNVFIYLSIHKATVFSLQNIFTTHNSLRNSRLALIV